MWVVRAFAKGADQLAGEIALHDFTADVIRPFFAVAPEDPMYDAYPVSLEVAEALSPYLAGTLDLEKYDYFVEFHRD
jgi:hypothetical protein